MLSEKSAMAGEILRVILPWNVFKHNLIFDIMYLAQDARALLTFVIYWEYTLFLDEARM